MAKIRSLTEMISSTATDKLATARARQTPDNTAEKPRTAILDALKFIESAIASDGYAFSANSMKFSKKQGDFTYEISFQSDRNNAAGQRAAVWTHTLVHSRICTTWSRRHSSDWIRPATSFQPAIFVSQLGYLCKPAGWMEWDFADHTTRHPVAGDLLACIRERAYPVFATFEAGADKIAQLIDRGLTSPEPILRYLLSAGHHDLAKQSFNRYLQERPDLQVDFQRLRMEFETKGIPGYRSGEAHNLAGFAVATGFPWST